MSLVGTKEGSALVFMREIDGKLKSLKYDFKDNRFYSGTKKDNWRLLKNSPQGFFRGVTKIELLNSFDNEMYREFLNLVFKVSPDGVRNIATMMGNIQKMTHFESWLHSGILFRKPWNTSTRYYGNAIYGIKHPVTIYQKDVFLFMQEISQHNKEMNEAYENNYEHEVEFDHHWEERYLNENGRNHRGEKIEGFQQLIINLCTFVRANYHKDFEIYEWLYNVLNNQHTLQAFRELTQIHRLEYKALFRYLVEINRREAIDMPSAISLLRDYLDMSVGLRHHRVMKYPKLLKLRHDIATRNSEVDVENIPVERFKKHIDFTLDWMDKTHAVIAPVRPQEMVEEGNKLSHCVKNYITSVMNGQCQIMFLRDIEVGSDPLVTLEIKQGDIVQVRGYDNRNPTPEEKEVLVKFAKKNRLNYKQGGYDATEDKLADQKKLEAEERKNERINSENGKQNYGQEVSAPLQYASGA